MTPSSVFSDEDLKRLKEEIYELRFHSTHGNLLLALLERLECAEAVASLVGFVACDGEKQHRLLETWRKSCGRE